MKTPEEIIKGKYPFYDEKYNLDINKTTINTLIELFAEKLKRYEEQLAENPDSLFYKGLVKNTSEYIEELKQNIREIQQ